jgi:hypothetical protein
MKLEDLGFDPRTGLHDKRLTAAESKFAGIMWTDHVGAENAISADSLAIQYHLGVVQDVEEFLTRHEKSTLEEWKRDVRYLQNHLLTEHENIPIYSRSGSGGGYWVALSEDEGEAFYSRFRKRGMTGLVKAARGKKAVLVDMVKQLSFEFEELQDKTAFVPVLHREMRGQSFPAPVEVVDAFLERMLKDPEKFADGLRKIGKKYGGVLLPREQIAAMKAKASELQKLVAEL